tara:strand:+ start:2683 stop:10866 length:8184 start_codon:yes stop_codon:yes gene_type:complete
MSSPIDISKPYYLDLPSGERIDFPAGTTAREARIFLMRNRPELFSDSAGEEDRSGFFPGLVSSAQRLSSEISAAVPATYAAITGDEESLKAAQEIAQEGREAVQETLPDPATVESIKESYDKDGLWSAIGESWDLAKESTGSQVPIFVGTFGAGALGAAAAPAVGLTAAAGTLIGGLAWTAAYTYSQFISESASEAESAKDIEALKSLAYTAPHTILNYLGYLATGAFGPVKQRAASATLSSVLNSTSKESGRLALAAAGKQAGESLLEFPTELAQTVLERSFSGESISPDDADFVTSMIETAAATIAPTALFGGVGAYRAHRQENLRQNEFRKLIDEEKIHRESLREARERATANDEENANRIFQENVRRYEDVVGRGREADESFIRYAEEQGSLLPVTFSDVVEAFSSRGLDYGSLGSQYVDAFILRNTDGKARKLSDLEDRASLPREERDNRSKLRRRVYSVASGLKGYAYSQYGEKSSSRAGIPLSFYSKAQFDQVIKRLKQRKKVTTDTIRSVLTYSDGSRFGNSKIEKRVASEILRDLESKNYVKKNKDGSFKMYNPGYTESQYREIIDAAKEKGEIEQEDFEKVTGKYGEAPYNRFVDDAINRMDLKRFRPREILAEEDLSVEPIVTVVRPVKYPQFKGQRSSPDRELNYNFPYYRGAGEQNVNLEEAEGYFVRDSDGNVVDGSTNEAEAKRIANYLNSISGSFKLLKNGEAYKTFASREMANIALKGEVASLGPRRSEDIFVIREVGGQTFDADSRPSLGYRVVEKFVGEDGSKSDFYEDSFSPDLATANRRLEERENEYYTGASDWEKRSVDRIKEVLDVLEGSFLGAGRTAEQVLSREDRVIDPARFDLQRNQEGELEPAPPPPLNEMEQKVVDAANKALSSLGLGNIDALVRGTLGDGVPAAYDLLRRQVLISLDGISKASTQAEIDEIVASRVGHEVIHALRDMDVFNPEEWNSLVDASRRVKVGKHILDEGQEGINKDTTYFDAAVMIYQNSVPTQIASDEDAKADFFAEEAVAMMHEGYKTDTRVSEQLAPKSRTILDKIKDFFLNLYTSISTLGYEDPGAILNDISNKSIAGRIAEDVDLRTYDPEIRTIRPSYRAFSRAATPGVQRPASGVSGLQETQTIGGVQTLVQTEDDQTRQSRTRPDTFEMSGSAEFDPATGMWNDGEFVSIGDNLNSQHLIDSVDQIPTEEELNSWGPFRDKVLTAKDRSSLNGKDARLRIDINFFNHHKSRDGKGKYAVTVHDTKDGRGRRVPLNAPSPGKRIGYDTIARLLGPVRFGSNDRLADRILNEGMTKQPIAVVEGKYTTNRSIPKDIDKWTPVGYDPHKANFFYDKRTGDEIISGRDAISIGNTVFVRSVDPWNEKTFKRYSADMASEVPMRPRRNVYTEQERARIEDRIADQVSEMSADEALKYSKKNSMKLEESFGPDGLEYKARFPVDGIDFTMSIGFTEDIWENPFNEDMETITDIDFTIAVSDKEARTKLRDRIRQMESDGMIVPDAISAMLSRDGTYRSIDWRSFFNEDPSRKILHTALSGIDKFISSGVGKAEAAIGFEGSGKSRIISEGPSGDTYSYRIRRSARERIYSRIAEIIAKKNNYDLLQTVELLPDYGSGTSTSIDPEGLLSFSKFYLVDRASQYNSAFKNRYLEFKETVYAGSPQDLIYEKLRSVPENVSIKVKSNEDQKNFEIDGEDFHDNIASFFFKRSQTKASNPASIPYINTAPPGSLEIRPDIDFRKQLRLEAEEIATGQSEGLKMSRSQIDQDNNRSASVNRSAEYQTVLDSLSPEYENLSLIQKIKNAFWDPIERKDFLSSIRRGMIDKLSPIATTEEEANRARRELGYDERLTADVRAVSAAYQKDKASLIAQESILYGQPEYIGGLTRVNYEKQGLMEIIGDVMNEGLFHDWHAWMISRREIRLGKDGKVVATGPDSELSKSLESGSARSVIDAELDKNPGRRELFEKTNEAYQEWNANLMTYLKDTGVIDQNLAAVLTRFNDYIPFYRVFDGTASSSMSSDINNIIGESIDLLRETIDPETGLPVLPPREQTKEPGGYNRGAFGSIVEVKAPTKIKKGGEGLIVDPLDGIFRNLEAALNAGMANVAATKVLGDALILGKALEVDKRRVDRSSANIVTIRENGQDRSFEVDDAPLFHALSGLMEGDLPMMSIFSAPANWLREGVVRMPDFMVANLMKDSLQTFVTSGSQITPFVDTLRQFTKGGLGGKQIHGKNDPHSAIMKLRGAGVIGGIEMSRRAGDIRKVMEKRMRKQGMTVSGKKGSKLGGAHWNPISKIWDTLGDVSTKSDAATRMAVYENTYQRMIQKGYSKIQAESEAIFQAQEIMNFSRRGSNKAMRYITAAIPFLNARIQGLDLLWRAGRGKYNSDFSQVGKARSFQSLLGRASLITAVTFLYALMMHDDEDWYSATPEAQDDYWFVKIGGYIIKIPVPFEIGFLFKTVPERIIRNLLAGKKEGLGAGLIPERAYSSGRQTADSLWRGLTTTFKFSPMESPLLKPFASVDSFTKRPIVPLYLEKKLPEEQYRDSTSALARIAGSATGISPLRLEYLTRAFTGSTGAYLLNITDNFWRSASGMPSRPEKNIGEMAFFKRFVVPTGISAGPMSQFYQFFNEVEKIYNTIQGKIKVGDIEGARELAEKYPNVIPAKKQADRIRKALADIREQQSKFNLQDRSRKEKDEYRTMANERRREILSGLPSLVKETDLGMF